MQTISEIPAHITASITTAVQTQAIYAFGQRSDTIRQSKAILPQHVEENTNHYWLLVFTNGHKPADAARIAKAIHQESVGRTTATILLHKTTALRQHPGNQACFFHNVISNGILLYHNPETPIPALPKEPHRQLAATHDFWERRKELASLFLDAHDGILQKGVGQVQAMFLRTAVEHTCLGIIRVFLGYRPNHFGINFLLDLCAYFSPLPNEFFPSHNNEGRALRALLDSHTDTLRRGAHDNIMEEDIAILARLCHGFITAAITAGNIEIASHL